MCCRLPSTWPFPRCPEATPASHSPAPDLACLNSKAKRAKSISSGVLSKHASRIQWQISGKHRRKPWTDSLWKSFSPLSARSFSISNVSVVEGQWQRLGHCNWELKSSGGCGAAWSPGITLPAQHGRSHIAPLPGAALFPAGKHLPNSNGRQTNSKLVQQETCKQCFSKKKSAFYEVHHYISLLALKSRRQTQFLFRIWFWSVCIKMEKYSLWEKAPLAPFWLEIHTNEQCTMSAATFCTALARLWTFSGVPTSDRTGQTFTMMQHWEKSVLKAHGLLSVPTYVAGGRRRALSLFHSSTLHWGRWHVTLNPSGSQNVPRKGDSQQHPQD